jgi:drug/metabolite transporter (DMT)-like permease
MKEGAAMKPMAFALALTVASNLLYHVSQKSIPSGAHPLMSLLVNYVVAIVLTLLLWPVYPGGGPTRQSLSALNWSSVAVGVAIVGVEIGVLLAYRSGWRVSVGATAINVSVAVLLVPIGLLYFGERLSAGNLAGLLLCVAGLFLLVQR